MTYEQAKKDWKTLWAIAPAADMTGGYVDQGDLLELLESPTKATAKRVYLSQIHYWLEVGTEDHGPEQLAAEYPAVARIAERHGHHRLADAARSAGGDK